MTISGMLQRRKVGRGSKSEHQGIVLSSASGDLIFRRVGANPFSDPELEAMVGQNITADGELIAGGTFLARTLDVTRK